MYRRAAPKEIFDSAVPRNFPGKFKVRNEYTVSHNITK